MFRSTALRFFNNMALFHVVSRKSVSEPVVCIRISYVYGGEGGYFHMFRSTALRFFNNMAVAITTRDEMIESLHSICESIMVARDVAKLPPIPFHDGVKLERRKSKVHPIQGQTSSGRSSLYLDLSRLPTLPKNVSETQLVADIRSVGSKALTNMTEQFSKLNKLSHSLNARARPALQLRFDQGTSRTKKMFTLGQPKSDKKKGSLSDGLSSDYSSDDENRTNIFEPTLDNFENTQHYIGKTQKTDTENDCELIENPLYTSQIQPTEQEKDKTEFVTTEFSASEKQTLRTPSNIKKTNPFNAESVTPEIQVETCATKIQPNSLVLSQKLSHSSSDINYEENPQECFPRSNSQHDLGLNIAQSHSESALRQLRNMASPVSSATRDMVLSPFSKLAKGVQTLANLHPRKKGAAGVDGDVGAATMAVKHVTEQQIEEQRQLVDKWRDCNTRLLAL
ncbi:hypothetical protein O0L34_g14550 [Tuta absoluta]|nr:hypothetical protein O0L34_g14550 [Tuta absoluta]